MRIVRLLWLCLLAVAVGAAVAGCPLGSRQGADPSSAVRGATEAADTPGGGMPQSSAGEGGENTKAISGG